LQRVFLTAKIIEFWPENEKNQRPEVLFLMFETCLEKQKKVLDFFTGCTTAEEKYQKIIDLGKTQPHLDLKYKTEEHLVQGCQSRMYLHAEMRGGFVFFEAEADALISAGLGCLLLYVYSGETPEVILKCPPHHIDELGIRQTLTPGRANGLASVYLRIKQEALKFYMAQNKSGGDKIRLANQDADAVASEAH